MLRCLQILYCWLSGDAHRIRCRFFVNGLPLSICLTFALAIEAKALTEAQLIFVRESVIELCRGGTIQGEASTYRIEGEAEARIFVFKKLIEAGIDGEVELSGNEWSGIQAVIPENWDANAWNGCVLPTLEFFANKLDEEREDSTSTINIEDQIRAMEWFESRCGPGVEFVVPYSVGSTSDIAARSFFAALGESGVKPLYQVLNISGPFIDGGRFSVSQFDAWARKHGAREGCLLVLVPNYVKERFQRPYFNLTIQEKSYAVVLPRGTLSEVSRRWSVVFNKAMSDPDFIREIRKNPYNLEVELSEVE